MNKRILYAIVSGVLWGLISACAPPKDLWQAARDGDIRLAKRYLRVKMRETDNEVSIVNERDEHGEPALFYAVLYGNSNIVVFLVEEGADVNYHCEYGLTPLSWAVDWGYPGIARYLIAQGAFLQPTNDEWDTPLHHAAYEGDEEMVRLLVQAGADTRRRTFAGYTPAGLAKIRHFDDVYGYLKQQEVKKKRK